MFKVLPTSRRDADADRISKPEVSTSRSDGRVPLVELLEGDAELALDLVATIAALDRVVLVAIGRFTGLGRCSWTISASSRTDGGSANAVCVTIKR